MALVHLKGWDPALFQSSVWFSVLTPELERFANHPGFPSLDELRTLLTARCEASGVSPLSPVYCPPKTSHRKKRKEPIDLGSLYDVRISEHHELPTRENDWHDFFNVLAFAAFPRAKRALHARQARLLRARIAEGSRKLPGARTREQDALTLLDEGGVLVAADPVAYAALSHCDDDMTDTLITCVREQRARLVPFGHALFEHLIEGLPCPLAIPQLLPVTAQLFGAANFRDELDRALCERVSDAACFVEPTALKGLALDRYLPA